jgi:sulfite reductase alpha subunit
MAYLDELHRPFFPHKFKIKCSVCPNDCAGAIARSDLAIIGIWKDEIQIDQQEVRQYADEGLRIKEDVVDRCPSQCMDWNGSSLFIDDSSCVKCMHCINLMTKALRPGKERGATLLIGGKVPITEGPRLASVLVPFWQLSSSYDALKDLIDRILEVWGEEGRNRERVGEFIQRIGLGSFIKKIGIDPVPEMIESPRENPYMRHEKAQSDQGESL